LQGLLDTLSIEFFLKNKGDEVGIGYTVASIVAEIVLGILASMIVFAFSRYREYRADEAGARLSSTYNMIAALEALKRAKEEPNLPDGVKAFGINGKSLVALFSTHPTLESRIENLKKYTRS
jgi:heat shock protein HtpX